MQSVTILEDIKLCYQHHARFGTSASLVEVSRLLRSQVERFDVVFIVIDALDECPEFDQIRKSFLTEVRRLLPRIRLMVTSRQLPSIEGAFKLDTRLEIRAQDQDVRKFIQSQMGQRDELVDILEGHDDLQASITTILVEKTNGMLVVL